VAAAFGTLQWVASRPVTNAPAPAATAAPVQPQTTQPAPATTPPPAMAPRESAVTKKPHMESSVATSDAMRSARVVGNAPPQASAPTAAASATADGGVQELNLAQGYLEGKHGVRDPAEGAKWLWKAVAKQNTTADVLLANLYMSGDGVSKSCAQARLLLTAAAQKGEPTAGARLRQLESTCR
jgi:TPR repeat protein